MMKIKARKKRTIRRFIASILIFAMVMGFVPMPLTIEDVKDGISYGVASLKVHAAQGDVTITYWSDLLAYVNSYTDADKSGTITIQCTDKLTIPSDFVGIGTSTAPFEGKIVLANVNNDDGGASKYLQLQAPLFNYISDKATIVNASDQPCTLFLYPDALSSGTYSTPLFASHVAGVGGTANWSIKVNDTDEGSDPPVIKINARSSIIGEMYNKTADPSVTLTYYNQNAAINGTSDLGVICNSILAGSLTLVLSNGIETGGIMTSSGNVGGLVGTMATGTTLNLNTAITCLSKRTIETKAGYAGGLVGKCEGTVSLGLSVTYNDSMQSEIIGTTGAGGLFGYFATSTDVSLPLDKFIVTSKPGDGLFPGQGIRSDLDIGKTGGLIGELINNGTDAVILLEGSMDDDLSDVPSIDVSLEGNYGGGIIGYYQTNTLANALCIRNLFCKSEGSRSIAYGGLIGTVDSTNDCGAYISVSNVKINLSAYPEDQNILRFRINKKSAGVLEYAKNSFIDFSDRVKVVAGVRSINAGLLNNSENGVIRLAGTTDFSDLRVEDDLAAFLVNTRGNTLVYALGNGSDANWKYIRPNFNAYTDDIKTWGQVVRYVSTVGEGTNNTNLQDAGVVTVDSDAHTVTLAKDVSSISTSAEFAKTALNIKLNISGSNFGALCFENDANTSAAILNSQISLTQNINLSGTGLTGFTRDNGANSAFTGTFNGGGKSITLAIGEAFGYRGNDSTIAVGGTNLGENGVNQNYMIGAVSTHAYNGLFAKLGSCTINSGTNSLTLLGNAFAYSKSAIKLGGLAAEITGATVNINNVISSENIYLFGGDGDKYIGFLVGDIPGTDPATLNVKNCSLTGTANIWKNGTHVGLIGRIADSAINVLLESINLTGSINYKGTGRPYAGGLVGSTSSNDAYKRNLTLKDIIVNGLTVATDMTGNAEAKLSNPAGALLGGQWYNTNVFFGDSTSSVTITSGTLTLTENASCAGGLVAEATGYWQVNDVDITAMTITGATDAIGLLVMRGKSGSNGLYLETTDSSAYSIASSTAVTLPASVTVYDEIMAYSKSVVTDTENEIVNYYPSEANGQAIISIHTSKIDNVPKLSMNVDNNNSYVPKTSLGNQYNPYSRYYYNLDYLLDNAASAGEKLLLWSVNQYCTKNIRENSKIKSEHSNKNFASFSSLPTAGSTCDLEYLSYYPVDIGTVTLPNDYTVIMHNAQMEEAHGVIYSTRNANASGNYSQHYLLHAGIFKNVTNKLAVKDLTLKGDVSSHVGAYNLASGSGALVCGEINGSANAKNIVTIDGIKLDGIKIDNQSENDIEALLIKQIGSYVEFKISNVKVLNETSYNYVDPLDEKNKTRIAAAYLLGEADGVAMSVVFDKMILDGRAVDARLYDPSVTASESDALKKTIYELNTAYNTYNSIFSDATFLKSLHYESGMGSSAKYNYKYNEDWGSPKHQVTYAFEITGSTENINLQMHYVDQVEGYFTSPESELADEAYEYFTAGNFIKHVSTEYNSAENYHEVAVNIVSYDLEIGCGTYNDPYVVDENTLPVIAKGLSGEGFAPDFKINIDDDYITGKDINFEKYCTNKTGHTQYKFNGSVFKAEGKADIAVDEMQRYLAGAYYYIASDMELSDKFVGLGSYTSAQLAFRGVIVGADDVTIVNKSDKPLINVSNGCVVKNLTITIDNSAIEKAANEIQAFGYGNNKTQYYGGVIGEIMGGDNVIDKVKVHYNYPITVSGAQWQNVPVGGYIGVVVNGSVFFRNMESINASNDTITYGTGEEAVNDTGMNYHVSHGSDTNIQSEVTVAANGTETFKTLYVNPIIGRVINGFAVNESDSYRFSEDGYYVDKNTAGRTTERATANQRTTLKNNRKNFSIPDFNATSILSISGDTITASDAQALYILSLICQTNMGSARNANPAATTSNNTGDYLNAQDSGYDSTSSGKLLYRATHLAEYDGVGKLSVEYAPNPGEAPSEPGEEPVQEDGETAEEFETRHLVWEVAYETYDKWHSKYLAYVEWQEGLAGWNENYGDDLAKITIERVNSAKEIPYLIYKYTNGSAGNYPARTITNSNNKFNVSLNTNKTTYYMPDSFRGLGYISSNNVYLTIKNFNGNDNIIDVNTYFRAYASNIDNYYNADLSTGIGLFNTLKQDGATGTNGKPGNSSTSIGFFKLSGYLSGKRSNGSKSITEMANTASYYDIRVGGIAPVNSAVCNITNVNFDNLNIDGSTIAGALFAQLSYVSYVNNCNADKLKVVGHRQLGGMVGSLGASLYFNTVENASSQFKLNVHQLDAGNSSCYTGGIIGQLSNINNTHLVVSNTDIIGWNGVFGTSNALPYIGRAPGETLANNTLFVGGVLGFNANNGNNDNKGIIIALEKVHVYGLNMYGHVVGGMIGHDGDNATIYAITDCGIHGKSDEKVSIDDTKDYVIKAYSITGGIIGRDYNEYNKAGGETFTFDTTFTYCNQINGAYVDNYILEQTNNTNYNDCRGVGGIIGASRNNKSIKNVKVQNCKLICNGSNPTNCAGMGGIIGGISKHTINGYNIIVQDITFDINTNGVNQVPYGLFAGYGFTGSNNTVVKLVGYSTQGNNTILPAFGYTKDKKVITVINAVENGRNVEFDCGRKADSADLLENKFVSSNGKTYIYSANSYIVYADYEGASNKTNVESASTVGYAGKRLQSLYAAASDAPTISVTDNFPYVNSSPSILVKDKSITSDGIWFDSGENLVVKADRILADRETYANTSIAKKYANITDADIELYNSLKTKFSTFNTQYGESYLSQDIPVIVMDNKSENLTSKIYAYIRILTNSSEAFTASNSSIYGIKILKCTCNGDTLSVTTNGASLERDSSGTISMNTAYDSEASVPQFTIIDVQFKDPANTSKIAYHLYIPVYTKKAFNFKFDITALSGTSYYRTDYTGGTHFSQISTKRGNDQNNVVVEDYGTPITMFLRYEYDMNNVIKDILASGHGLEWNYDKSLDIVYNYSDDNALPRGTKFVLVDVNRSDKAFYSTNFTPSANADLDINSSTFQAYSVGGVNYPGYRVVTFKELMQKYGITLSATALSGEANITTAKDNGTPIFHSVDINSSDARQFTVSTGLSGKALVPASEAEITAGVDLYTVSANTATFYEDYYLTIYAPADDGDIRHQIQVKSKVNLEKEEYIKANCIANDNVVLMLANLFTKSISIQTVENDTLDKEVSINGQKTIDVLAVSTIAFNGDGLGSSQLNEIKLALDHRNVSIYHSTKLHLVRYEEDGSHHTVAVDGVSFSPNSAPSVSTRNYMVNSGVYVKMANGTEGDDIFYSADAVTEDRYKQMISCSSSSYLTGRRETNFYEVINSNNGNKIDLRPYLTGEAVGDDAVHEVKIVANFKMTYDGNGIIDQFPTREADGSAGTIVKGQASLSYQPDGTTFSNNASDLTDATPVNRKYYRKDSKKTTLYYNIVNDDNLMTADVMTKTNTMLGVNPLDKAGMVRSEIKTWGNYDASSLLSASSATQVKWTVKLYQRQAGTSGTEYCEELEINEYLKNVKVYGFDHNTASKGTEINISTPTSSTEYVYIGARELFEDITSNKFIVYVDFDVVTGTDLQTAALFYSNYKVVLTAELVGNADSGASDHIIYTNARLDPAYIDVEATP